MTNLLAHCRTGNHNLCGHGIVQQCRCACHASKPEELHMFWTHKPEGCDVCLTLACTICEHPFGDHYQTYDGEYNGCASCFGEVECEGFG